MRQSIGGSLLLLFWIGCVLFAVTAFGQETTSDSTAAGASTSSEETTSSTSTDGTTESEYVDDSNVIKPIKKREKRVLNFDVTNEDWGTYYDPQSVFCGQYDCYKILGFDYESYSRVKPTTKEITQRYRALSREWHPDKSKHKNAKEKFVKIARAYEVLTDIQVRKEYDTLRYDQQKYFAKYGTSVMWSYKPKTDVTIVILLVLIISNVISWYAQKHRWQLVADRLIKATVEDWLPKDGGTPESKQLREDALAIAAKREASEADDGEVVVSTTRNGTTTATTKGSTKKKVATASSTSNSSKVKLTPKEKKIQEQIVLLPIVTELVNGMDDFGSGFHKPTWEDLIIITLLKLPITIGKGFIWQSRYLFRKYILKQELNEEEKQVLTERAVGPVVWNTSSDLDQNEMIKEELWITSNLVEWKKEREIKKLSLTEQKLYYKLKKKGQLEKFEKSE